MNLGHAGWGVLFGSWDVPCVLVGELVVAGGESED